MGIHGDELLVVDDTPENLQVLGDILRGKGLLVRFASSGEQALRSVAARRPDVVLMDVRMPEPDGLEICRRLHADQSTVDLPVIFLSAGGDREERLLAFAAGGVDFIAKPFQAAEVLARINVHLQMARMRRELAATNMRLAELVVLERQQRRQVEGLASDRQARLDLVLDAAGMGTWSGDRTLGSLRFDPAALVLLGREVATWSDLAAGFAEPDQASVRSAWEGRLADDAIFRCEGWWPLATGRRRLRLLGRSLPGQGDSLLGLLSDVTTEHEERQRRVQGEKLESLGQLAGGLAHDFNNHLGVIIGSLDLLRRNLAQDTVALQRLARIDQAAMTAAALVRDLLSFARRRDVAMSDIVLARVAIDLAPLLGSLLGRRCQVAISPVDESVHVLGCREQLQNAVLNLCVNARDAMPNGGGIRIAVQRLRLAGEPCRITGDRLVGDFAALAVADDGCGIPSQLQERIFEPFFTTKGEGKGTGLGLATVAGCVRSHGGHLLLDSAPGRGSVFTLLLPLAA